jgi:Iron-containing redox enzyme
VSRESSPLGLSEPPGIGRYETGKQTQEQRHRLLYDDPVPLPSPRGPVSAALIGMIAEPPSDAPVDPDLEWFGSIEDAAVDDDLQLALWLSYELHYRGLAGVDDAWEWQPMLRSVQQSWEDIFVRSLRRHAAAAPAAVSQSAASPTVSAEDEQDDLGRRIVRSLTDLAQIDDKPSLSGRLMKTATVEQFTEFLIHRSLYHLKEADPHTWAIPRLSGAVKAALITIQLDEYGLGSTPAMHAQLFRTLMQDWSLDTQYGGYLKLVGGVTLLSSNLISMFGLHRRWRGALVGHLALFEMTSSTPNARYARAHRRLGGGEAAARFFDEHVVADALHEQIAAYDLAAGLARTEPQLADDIEFGARCSAFADRALARHLVGAWDAGRSSLYAPGAVV